MEPNEVGVDEINDVDVMQVLDCQICCQPIEMTVYREGDSLAAQVEREND